MATGILASDFLPEAVEQRRQRSPSDPDRGPPGRYGAKRAAFIVAGLWAFWHLPFFVLISSYRGSGPFMLVGFLIGIASGSVVLTWLYYGSGQSILAVAVWHATYNMAAATAASSGTVAAVASALVIAQAVLLIRRDARAQKRGRQPIIGPKAKRPAQPA